MTSRSSVSELFAGASALVEAPARVFILLAILLIGTLSGQSVGNAAQSSGLAARAIAALVDRSGAVALTVRGSVDRTVVVRAGRYVLSVRDLARKQNFHFVGPGLDKRTTLRFVGTRRWQVQLRPGVYLFWSDARPRVKKRLRVS